MGGSLHQFTPHTMHSHKVRHFNGLARGTWRCNTGELRCIDRVKVFCEERGSAEGPEIRFPSRLIQEDQDAALYLTQFLEVFLLLC